MYVYNSTTAVQQITRGGTVQQQAKKHATTYLPSTCYTAIIQQYSSRRVGTNRVAVWYSYRRTNLPTHDVLQQHSSKAADSLAQTEVAVSHTGISISYMIPRHSGERSVPGRAFRRPPLAESVIRARSLARA